MLEDASVRSPLSLRRFGWAAALVVVLAAASAGGIVLISRPSAQVDGHWHLETTADLWPAEAVSCVSFTDCWAVGYERVSHLSNGAWANVPLPSLGGDQGAVLFGVACPTSNGCWAVGQDFTSEQLLVAHEVGGRWTLTKGAGSNIEPEQLNAVTCVGPDDCWAVGFIGPTGENSLFQPLIEHYSGIGWSVVNSPGLGSGGDLAAVTCSGASECWAVGTNGGEDELAASWISPLIELYAGGQWTVAASPRLGGPGGLSGVSCASAEECWAVGHSGVEPTDQPLIEQGLGGSWSIASSPRIDASNGAALLSIACPEPASCWAVGELPPVSSSRGAATGPTTNEPPEASLPPLIEGSAGGTWTVVEGPGVPGGSGTLNAVTCVTPAQCWAVGGTLPGVLIAENTS